jgi:FkbM family methyltransferase
MIKKLLINYFPGLGKYKRYWVAMVNSMAATKESYSQHKEDKFIWETLQQFNLKGSVYIDVGANHPTDISNTYLLYRKGLQGIIVEPNEELIHLFKKFRNRDIPLQIGCSNTNTILQFNISRTPVVSSFSTGNATDVYKSLYLPVMRLDDAVKNLEISFVSFYSIDVEGLNYEVSQGSTETIQKSLLICIEIDKDEEQQKMAGLLGDNFEFLKKFGCNLLYLNKQLASQKDLTKTG